MTKKEKTNSQYHVPNLERALLILELLAQNPAGLTAAQITDKLNVARNSVFRITATLINYGYLRRDEETKVFQLTNKLLSIGYSALSESGLVEKALPIMRDLRDKVGETVPMGILHGTEGIVIEEVPGIHAFRFVLEPGKKFNLHTAAPAKAILAYSPQSEADNIISNLEYTKFNERTIIDAESYKQYLREVRDVGYAVDKAEEIEGMHCIGAPVFNFKGYPCAAIWITGPSFRIRETDFQSIGKLVRKYADRISQSLGFDVSNAK